LLAAGGALGWFVKPAQQEAVPPDMPTDLSIRTPTVESLLVELAQVRNQCELTKDTCDRRREI